MNTRRAARVAQISCTFALTLAVAMGGLAPPPVRAADERPLILQVAGVSIGTTDAQLVERLGPGCSIAGEPHAGGRYFVDAQRRVTLHVLTGSDRNVGAVVLSEGQLFPRDCLSHGKVPVSPALEATPPIDHGIRFGMTPAEVIAVLGKPDQREEKKQRLDLYYFATSETDKRVLSEYAGCLTFWKGRLVSVMITDND